MNWEKFKQNVGMRFQLTPPARSVDARGVDVPVPEQDYWTLTRFTGPDSFQLSRTWSGHIAELGKDHVYDFRSDPAGSSTGIRSGYLVLKMQVVVSGRDLRLIPNARPGEAVPPLQTSKPGLSQEAKVLLLAAAKDDGVIMRLAHLGGTDVQAGGRNFVESNNRRTVAKWEAAVEELEREGLTEDKTGRNQVYFVTHEGFRVADTVSGTS